MTEVWLPIPGYEGLYEVSNTIKVKSLTKIIQRGKYNAVRVLKEKILKPCKNDVTLVKNKNRKTFNIYTIYKSVFDGFKPNGDRKICLLKINNEVREIKRRQVCQIAKSKLLKSCPNSMGVSLIGRKYRSAIKISKKDIHLGVFETEKDAYNIYLLACKYEYLYNGNAKDFRTTLNNKINDRQNSSPGH